ncbi:MAG: hypothetical protein ACSLFQ_12025 [Thermoanaerobaculia bacterium]
MRVITLQVAGGQVNLPADVQDGTVVAILAPDTAGFLLSEDDKLELSAALEEIRSGDYISGNDLLAELKCA